MDLILAKKRVLLLVSGGIAIYKSLDLISNLKKEGAEVFVVMSEEATRFIAPLTFEAMSGNKVLCRATESFPQISHISYANLADIAIIAPATINTIAKLNYGIADNLIVETLLACKCEVFIAPSANVNMLESPQNMANLDSLKNMGYKIIAPRTTLLACNVVANGAMAEVGEIIFQLKREVISGNSPLGLQFRTKIAESSTDSAPLAQNLVKNNSCEAPENSPASWCKKSESKGAVVPPADFLLEADKRGTLPKSEKRQLLARRESGERGAALLRKESSNNENVESVKNQFVDCHADSANLLAMTDNKAFAESALDSVNKDGFANFWHDKNIVITGGGSVEAIDSIRHISNDSSGKQASNLALAFYYLGARVSLIASKFPISLPLGVEKIAVKSSADFRGAIENKLDLLAESSIFISAAAISDFVPKQKAQGKLKKEQIGEAWDLHLVQNDDILSEIAKKFGEKTFIVGFKAESEADSASANAKKMLASKGCDMVVLNIIDKNNQIGGERNEVRIFTARDEIKIPQDSKLNISFAIAESIAQNLGKNRRI